MPFEKPANENVPGRENLDELVEKFSDQEADALDGLEGRDALKAATEGVESILRDPEKSKEFEEFLKREKQDNKAI